MPGHQPRPLTIAERAEREDAAYRRDPDAYMKRLSEGRDPVTPIPPKGGAGMARGR